MVSQKRGQTQRNAALVAASLMLLGCQRDAQRDRPHYEGPPVVIPTTSASLEPATAAWIDALPSRPADYAANTRVWATIPRGKERVEVSVYRVVGVYGGTVSLLDRRGQRMDGVPSALVHKAAPVGKLRVGDEVLCDAISAPGVLGRVSSLEGAIRVKHGWGAHMSESEVDHAEPTRKGITPMAYVRYRRASSASVGLVLALSEDTAWLRNGAGNAIAVPRKGLLAANVPSGELEVGTPVSAYDWQHGLRRGVVGAVLTPELRYSIRFENGDEEPMFFSQLTEQLEPK